MATEIIQSIAGEGREEGDRPGTSRIDQRNRAEGSSVGPTPPSRSSRAPIDPATEQFLSSLNVLVVDGRLDDTDLHHSMHLYSLPSNDRSASSHLLSSLLDSATNRKVLSSVLRKVGCRVIDVASDGVEALQAVRSWAEVGHYDLVFMDNTMPNMVRHQLLLIPSW